jgi:hypothetical protein
MAVGITNSYKSQARRGVVRLQDADTSLVTHNGTSVGGIPIPTTGKALLSVTVANFTGGTNVTVKVQHSVDGSSWADISGATSGALTGNGSTLVAFNGYVAPFVRAVATVTGTFTALTVTTDIYVTD